MSDVIGKVPTALPSSQNGSLGDLDTSIKGKDTSHRDYRSISSPVLLPIKGNQPSRFSRRIQENKRAARVKRDSSR